VSNLTPSRIACFDRFAERVEDFLNANSKPSKNGHRSLIAAIFEVIVTICFRPTALAPVMHNGVSLQATGMTKRRFQLRAPKTLPNGKPNPKADMLIFDRATGNPVYSKAHAQMYTAKAFREWRATQTGLKTPETVYVVNWDKVSQAKQQGLAKSFPPKRDGKPEFVPQVVGILLRKGNKPAKGEKRHSWQRLMLVVVGKYGEFGTCVIPNAAVWQSGCVKALGEAIGCPEADIPVWDDENEAQFAAQFSKAANAVMEAQRHGIDLDFDF